MTEQAKMIDAIAIIVVRPHSNDITIRRLYEDGEQQIFSVPSWNTIKNKEEETVRNAKTVAIQRLLRLVNPNTVVIHKDGACRTDDEIEWLVKHNADIRRETALEILRIIASGFFTGTEEYFELNSGDIFQIAKKFGVFDELNGDILAPYKKFFKEIKEND